jgi:hypothetical protein
MDIERWHVSVLDLIDTNLPGTNIVEKNHHLQY